MNFKTLFRLTPFMILGVITAVTWYTIVRNGYEPTVKYWAGLIFYLINLAFYLFRWKYAVLLTGVILLLATFNLLNFFVENNYSSFGITFDKSNFWTPDIQWKPLVLFLYYYVVIVIYKRVAYFASK